MKWMQWEFVGNWGKKGSFWNNKSKLWECDIPGQEPLYIIVFNICRIPTCFWVSWFLYLRVGNRFHCKLNCCGQFICFSGISNNKTIFGKTSSAILLLNTLMVGGYHDLIPALRHRLTLNSYRSFFCSTSNKSSEKTETLARVPVRLQQDMVLQRMLEMSLV